MKHLFVPYEIALLAKEKGFNQECLAEYSGFSKELFMPKSAISTPIDVPSPLYQQIVDWFREEHKIVVWVETSLSISHWNYRFKIESENDKQEGHKTSDYYQALNAAITEAFKLINP